VAFGDDPDQATAVEHRQVADAVVPHHHMRLGHGLIRADRVRHRRHEFSDRFVHACPLSKRRAIESTALRRWRAQALQPPAGSPQVLRDPSTSAPKLAGTQVDQTEIMTKLQRILVPVDFSPSSRAALDYAAVLARLSGAAVDVLHVWE